MPSIPTERTRASEILCHVQISDVYHALTGVKRRWTRQDICRAPAIWRGGDGRNVSMEDSRGVSHDLTSDEGGGVLDLVGRIQIGRAHV